MGFLHLLCYFDCDQHESEDLTRIENGGIQSIFI